MDGPYFRFHITIDPVSPIAAFSHCTCLCYLYDGSCRGSDDTFHPSPPSPPPLLSSGIQRSSLPLDVLAPSHLQCTPLPSPSSAPTTLSTTALCCICIILPLHCLCKACPPPPTTTIFFSLPPPPLLRCRVAANLQQLGSEGRRVGHSSVGLQRQQKQH